MKRKRIAGFTIIELMVTVTLLSVVLVLALPGFQSFIQNNRVATQANNFITALTLARSEALKRGTNVSVCASSDQATCTGAWNQGWIVFTDNATGSNAPAINTVIQAFEALDGNPSLTEASNATFVRYQSSGLVSAARAFTLTISNCTGDQQRTINVTATGQISVTRSAC